MKTTKQDKFYQFLYLGNSASGKTCMLAAMSRDSSDQHVCDHLPPDFPKLTDEQKVQAAQNQELNAMLLEERGAVWLKDAIAKLQMGMRPNGTAESMICKFKMGDGAEDGRGDYYVQMEDYPGEWIKPEQLQDPSSETNLLVERIMNYDGIIVVVEALHEQMDAEQVENINRQIDTLAAFFGRVVNNLDDKNLIKPVVLILSKWDRVSEIDFNSPQNEKEKLRNYLAKYPQYKHILQSLKSNAQGQELSEEVLIEETEEASASMVGIVYGKTAIFPVSAFGKAVASGSGRDEPMRNQEGFGLVEPFFWLAERCDEIELTRLKKQFNEKWKSRLKEIDKGIRKLRNRITVKTTRHGKELAELEKKVWCYRWTWRGVAIVVGFIIIYLAFAVPCNVYVHNQIMAINNQQTSLEGLQDAKDNLLWMKKERWNKLVLSNIDKNIANIDKKMDEMLWQPVEAAKELANKAIEANVYLQTAPNGPHAAEALKIIKEREAQIDNDAWQSVLAQKTLAEKAIRAKSYLKTYPNGVHVTEAHEIIKDREIQIDNEAWESVLKPEKLAEQAIRAKSYLETYPNGVHVTEAHEIIKASEVQIDDEAWAYVLAADNELLRKQRAEEYIEKFGVNGKHYLNAKTEVGTIEIEIEWQKGKSGYDSVCMRGDCVSIVESLIKIVHDFDANRFAPVVESFPELLAGAIEGRSHSTPKNEMIDICDKTVAQLRSLEMALGDKEQYDLAEKIMASIRDTNAKKEEFKHLFDKQLYESVRKERDKDRCNSYIDKMKPYGGATMQKEVEAYLGYLEEISRIQKNVPMKISVFWKNVDSDYEVRGTVKVDGTTIYNAKHHARHNSERELWNKPLPDEINIDSYSGVVRIEARFVSEGNWWGNKCTFGEGSNVFRLNELHDGGIIPLTNPHGYNVELRIKAEKTVKEAELPQWREK